MENKITSNLDWTPISSHASSFCTHRLIKNNAHKLEFVPTNFARVFNLLFFIIPSAFFVMLFIATLQLAAPIYSLLFGIIGVSIFFPLGFFLKKIIDRPRVFDLAKGEYYAIEKGIRTAEIEIRESIRAIQALQLLSKEILDSDSDYTSYELNLVFEDGRRLNVISHGGHKQIKEDAELLGKTLNIPILQLNQ
jgi:hypothetical protein